MSEEFKYEDRIRAAYKRVGFEPRGNQIAHINEIVVAFIDEQYKNVCLSAPTGTGKSIIGVIVAEVVQDIKFPGKTEGASFLLTATNALSEQYFDAFADGHDPNFLMLKGANNYECSALSTPSEVQTAEVCAVRLFQKGGMDDMVQRHCNHCEYRQSRVNRVMSRHLITNYSYFFVDRMYAPNPLPSRGVTVFDEAHLLNDLFTEHNAIYVSEKRIGQFIDEIAEHLKLGNTEVFRDLKLIREGLQRGKITEETHKEFLRVLKNCYDQVTTSATMEANRNVRNQNAYTRFSRMAKKYHGMSCKIDDYFIYGYPAVFEFKKKDVAKGQNDNEASVKPIFVGEMFEILNNAEHNLLMSATITKEYTEKTLNMTGETKYIRLDPQFPPENKKVVFFKPQLLNYNTMKDAKTIKQLCATVWQLVDHHTKKDERGIILAPSFNVVESLVGTLRNMQSSVKIFEHKRGEKLADVIEAFKAYPSGRPAIIITPSGYEGVDLPGDLSRYQIIVKCPFGSLGDKRVKTILERYPSIYSLTALQKVTQGAGRSVRGPDDWATTYMLDTAIQRLWNSPLNEWKNEFTTSFSSILVED